MVIHSALNIGTLQWAVVVAQWSNVERLAGID